MLEKILRLPVHLASVLLGASLLSASPSDKPWTHQKILNEVEIINRSVRVDQLPGGLSLRSQLGLVTASQLNGRIIHRALSTLYETRCEIMPNGDFLLMFPDGVHYAHAEHEKMNDLVAYRSTDQGRTWQGPTVPIDIPYNLHGFVPLKPKGSNRIYCFGTQPVLGRPDLYNPSIHTEVENAPIGFRWSDDNGYTWSDVTLIRPENDPTFKGMSVVRMCETESGVWLIGAHAANFKERPIKTEQYILRSTDQGKTWRVYPDARPGGWQAADTSRMDETTLVSLGGEEVVGLSRTPTGYLWTIRSLDGGLTWDKPKPTPLEHPDAPAMMFLLSDKKTLMVLHHNRFSAKDLPPEQRTDLGAEHPGMRDRAQVWVSLSRDGGRTWDEPRFLFCNALQPYEENLFRNYQCSYIDVVIDHGIVHFFVPHRWNRVVHLSMAESEIVKLPHQSTLVGKR